MSTTCPASIRQGLQEVIANIARPLSPVYTPQSCFCSVASGSRAALDLHPGAFQQDLRSGAFRHTVAVVAPYMIYPRGALWREQPLPTSFCSSSSGHPISFHKCVSSSSPASSSKASHASNVLTFISQVPIALFPCLSSSPPSYSPLRPTKPRGGTKPRASRLMGDPPCTAKLKCLLYGGMYTLHVACALFPTTRDFLAS